MSKRQFNDQHQPMSSWLDKLASDEFNNFTNNDLKDETVEEKVPVKYAGISSTWDKRNTIDKPMILNDSSRQVSNRPDTLVSCDQIEKDARQIMMTGVNLEKVASILNKKYSQVEMMQFNTIIPKLEQEFGKLGHIYLDASLIDDCNDLAVIKDTISKVSSIAIRHIKSSAKCQDCNFNKRSQCVKLSLNVTDDPTIKTAKEAKHIINKFAALRYINSYFMKSSDLTSYYNRLANENPDAVVRDFLIDVNNKRIAKQTTNLRLAAEESKAEKLANKQLIIKTGKSDTEISTAFKQLLIKIPSIRTAKSDLIKRYGVERVSAYIKEAKDDLIKFVKFINTKSENFNKRSSIAVEGSNQLLNKTSAVKLANAEKLAKSLLTFRQSFVDTSKNLIKMYGSDVAKSVIDKLASDREAQFLGYTFLDSSLYNSVDELRDVAQTLRKTSKTLFQIKDCGNLKLANSDGSCVIPDFQLVKNVQVDNKKQACRVLDHLRKIGFANSHDIDNVESKLKDANNGRTIKSFLLSANTKNISQGMVKQVTDVALKYAKDVLEIRKLAGSNWSSVKSLLTTLDSHVVNKNAFRDDVKSVINKSASEINTFIKQSNQYNTEIFSDDKNKVSDAILGQMI